MTRYGFRSRLQVYGLTSVVLTFLFLLVPRLGLAQGTQDPAGLDPRLPTLRAERLITVNQKRNYLCQKD